MKTIIHIDNAYMVTGAYKALLSFCRNYTNVRHVWVVPKGSSISHEVRKFFTAYELPFIEISRSPVKLFTYLPHLFINGKRLADIIKKEKPDVIHVNDLYNLTPYIARKVAAVNIPIVVHVRLLKAAFPNAVYNFWKTVHLNNADAIIAVSNAIKTDWDNNQAVKLIYDPVLIHEQEPRLCIEPPIKEPFRFLYLANYIPGKGQDDALMAIKQLLTGSTKNFIVDFYGSTMNLGKNEAYKTELTRVAEDLGINTYVNFYDAVVNVERVMKQYHAALHFSHAESFGMVCYEALFYGLPVISTKCGGPEEMIQDQFSGLLVPVKDHLAQANAMQLLLNSVQLCSYLSTNAYNSTRLKFKDAALELNTFFDQLLSSPA